MNTINGDKTFICRTDFLITLMKKRKQKSQDWLIINPLNEKDVKEFSKLATEVISKTPYYSQNAKKHELKKFEVKCLKQKIKDKNNCYVTAKVNNKIVGFCYGYFDAGTFWLEWIGVGKEFRRKGIATSMIMFAHKKLKSRVHKIWNDSRSNNKEAVAFFKKLKFEKVAHIKNHWYKQDFCLWQKFI